MSTMKLSEADVTGCCHEGEWNGRRGVDHVLLDDTDCGPRNAHQLARHLEGCMRAALSFLCSCFSTLFLQVGVLERVVDSSCV